MTVGTSRPGRATQSTAIRPAVATDWDGIATLLTSVSLPLDGARDHLDGFVVAEREGVIVGCAGIERYGAAALLRSLVVRETDRGSGLGVALVERCIADARAAGVAILLLLTTSAERFFPRFGFEVLDRTYVPEPVKASVEFRGACPASATAMRLDLA